MFRSRPGRNRWHFCWNCPSWPESDPELEESPPFERWCRTCVRMYEAGAGELEWPADPVVMDALAEAWERGQLRPPNSN